MKISAVISPKMIKHKKRYVIYDKISLINFLILTTGLLSGVLIFVAAEEYLIGEIYENFIRFSTDFSSKTSLEILSGNIISHIPYIALLVIFGLSIYGTIPILLISLIKTMGLGLVSAYIYSTYSLKGIEYSIMVFFPGKLILIFSILILMHICVSSSIRIRQSVAGELQTKYSLSEYLAKVSIGILLYLLSSLTDCLAVVCFSSLFNFS